MVDVRKANLSGSDANRRSKDGLQCLCKGCNRRQSAKWQASDHGKERVKRLEARYILERVWKIDKVCTGCKETKPLEGFCQQRGRKDGYSSYCRVCCGVGGIKTGARMAVRKAIRNGLLQGKCNRVLYVVGRLKLIIPITLSHWMLLALQETSFSLAQIQRPYQRRGEIKGMGCRCMSEFRDSSSTYSTVSIHP